MLELSSKYKRVLASALFAGLLASGCSDDDDPDTNSGIDPVSDGGSETPDASTDRELDGSAPDSAVTAGDAGLPESQIVDVTSAANNGEISTSQVAVGEDKAQNAQVRSFAQDMIAMHGAAQRRQEALAGSLGLVRQPSAQGDLMRATATQIVQQLTALPAGPEFDRAYITAQVMLHTTTLQTIDSLLLPSAKTAALRQELMTARVEVQTHLTQAQALQARLQPDAGPVDTD